MPLTVCRNAWRASGSSRDTKLRHVSSRSALARSPRRPSACATRADASPSRHAEPGQYHFGSRKRRRSEQRVELATEAAARHEDEALAALGELVRELHRDPAAQRVPDDRSARLAERAEQVAHRVRVGPERIVSPRLGRVPVPEKIGGDDRVALAEPGNHVLPRRRVACDPVKEDHRGPSPALR